jgi:hypothetical protein
MRERGRRKQRKSEAARRVGTGRRRFQGAIDHLFDLEHIKNDQMHMISAPEGLLAKANYGRRSLVRSEKERGELTFTALGVWAQDSELRLRRPKRLAMALARTSTVAGQPLISQPRALACGDH